MDVVNYQITKKDDDYFEIRKDNLFFNIKKVSETYLVDRNYFVSSDELSNIIQQISLIYRSNLNN